MLQECESASGYISTCVNKPTTDRSITKQGNIIWAETEREGGSVGHGIITDSLCGDDYAEHGENAVG